MRVCCGLKKFLAGRHFVGIFLFLLIASGWSFFFTARLLAPDSALIENFAKHRGEFERLIKMAEADSAVRAVNKDYVVMSSFGTWHDQKGFSNERWAAYKELFGRLENPEIYGVSKTEGATEIYSASSASTDLDQDYNYTVISKGYVYSLKEPSPLIESLDELGFESGGVYYKKIDEHWYLYHRLSVGKPE
jgi:hypothetical protein